ncbi:MAG: WYL domain-containing protein, partial [Carbonactinosporaceae bacterium]
QRPGGRAAPRGRAPRNPLPDTLSELRAALEDGRSLWLGYVDNHGSASERIVDPVKVEGGYLTAFDHRLGRVHTFAVHRITGVAAIVTAAGDSGPQARTK